MSCVITQLKIKKGSTFTFQVELQDENDCDKPLNLSGFTGATAYFAAQTGGSVAVTGSLTSAVEMGEITFAMTTADTLALEESETGTLEVVCDYNGQTSIAEFLEKVIVLPRRF